MKILKKTFYILNIIFKNLLNFIFFLPKLFTALLILIAIISFIRFSSIEKSINIEDNSVLYIPMEGLITEESNSNRDITDFFFQETNTPQIDFHLLLKAIKDAKEDNQIKGIFIDLSKFLGGYPAELVKITNQVNDFEKSGKFVLSYSDLYSQSAYLIASASSEIISYPSGGVLLRGFSSKRIFYKDFFEKIGLEVINLSEGQFKTAFENLTLSSMSDADRQQRLTLFNSIWQDITILIEENRNINSGKINEYLNNFDNILAQNNGDWGRASVSYELVDNLVKRGNLKKYIKEKYMPDNGELNKIDYRDYLKTKEASKESINSIAVINILGPIVDGDQAFGVASGNNISSLINKVIENESIKALVLRINTPGGSVFASELIRDALLRLKDKNIPIVTSMGGVAASGGYWVASSTDYIFAENLSITGSIGVASVIFNAEETLNKIGLNEDGVSLSVFSDTNKAIYSQKPNDRLIKLNKLTIKNIYEKFINVVSNGRNLSTQKVNSIAKGQVWVSKDALKLDLIDEIGSLEDAIKKASLLANIDEYKVEKIYEKKRSFFDFIPFIINEIGNKNSIYNRNIYLDFRFKALMRDIKNYNDPKGLYYLCSNCSLIM